MPLPTTKVIPDGWSEHHRPVVRGTLTAECLIQREQGEPVYDPITGNVTQPLVTIYTGKCRVQQLGTQGSRVQFADQNVVSADYLVVIDWLSEDIRVGEDGDHLNITVCEEDTALVGKPMYILAATYGSLRWERDLWASLVQTRSNPEEPA